MAWYDKDVEITHDERWKDLLRETYIYARAHSNDISTYTAASLADSKFKRLVIASNGFPNGAKEIPGWDQKPKKDSISNHAERAVVYEAAKKGIATKGLIMVMPWVPCFPCANAIIYSGIKMLVSHKQMTDRTPADWAPELEECLRLLRLNKVKILMYDGEIGGCESFMRREFWKP